MNHSLSAKSPAHHVNVLHTPQVNDTLHLQKPNEILAMDNKKTINGVGGCVSCNRCKLVVVGRESTIVVSLIDSHTIVEVPQKDKATKGLFKSWLFSLLKKKVSKIDVIKQG